MKSLLIVVLRFIQMRIILALFTGVTASLLIGCSSTPKPSLTDYQYRRIGTNMFTAQRCGELGLASPSDAMWGKRSQYFAIKDYAVDESRLQQEIWQASQSSTPSAETCNRMAISAREYQGMVEAHNASVDQNSRAMQQIINNSAPTKPVWCNRIGTQTFCN